jgi:hypothetical protein
MLLGNEDILAMLMISGRLFSMDLKIRKLALMELFLNIKNTKLHIAENC